MTYKKDNYWIIVDKTTQLFSVDLKFKAYENGTGVEMLLNGQKILPVDVDSTGIDTIIVVHREGEFSLVFVYYKLW